MDFEEIMARAVLAIALLMLTVCLATFLGIALGFITVLPCESGGDGCQYAPMVWPLPGGSFSIG